MSYSHVLFAGPSLPTGSYLPNLPYLDVRPPAAAGDIINYIIDNPCVEVLILADGFFFSQYAPLHRELQLALKSSIQVIGCSSLGALRAVELAGDGMLGFGSIYQYYLKHKETPDDEVCLLHTDDTNSYNHVSLPLINFRLLYNKTRSKKLRSILETTIGRLESVPFHQRTWDLIRSHLLQSSNYNLNDFSLLFTKYFDFKSNDLARLLECITEFPPRYEVYQRFNLIDLNLVHQDIISGQYRATTYILAPFRQLCALSDNEKFTELDFRDLFLLFSSNALFARDLIYNELLFAQAIEQAITVTRIQINRFLIELFTLFKVNDLIALCQLLRLCLYELVCFIYKHILLLQAEERIARHMMRGLNIETFLTSMRMQSRLPGQFAGPDLSRLMDLLDVSTQLHEPNKRSSILQLIKAGLFADLFHDSIRESKNSSLTRLSSSQLEKHELIEIIARLSNPLRRRS